MIVEYGIIRLNDATRKIISIKILSYSRQQSRENQLLYYYQNIAKNFENTDRDSLLYSDELLFDDY